MSSFIKKNDFGYFYDMRREIKNSRKLIALPISYNTVALQFRFHLAL